MLEGELECHKGNHDLAFAALRESVLRDDNLEYTEPWAWMHPPRHALAALQAEQGRFAEAEEVYRTDLGINGVLQRCAQNPDNVWALRGLVECLQRSDPDNQLPMNLGKLRLALETTDIPITSSCLCRMQTVAVLPSNCCSHQS